jgi:pimeloyl-ACP methyl ester carboxylesterase
VLDVRLWVLVAGAAAALAGGCGGETSSRPDATAPTEIQVRFPSGSSRLFGILTLPAGTGPHAAVVLLSGSERAGAGSPVFLRHARTLARNGIAVLRYDPPGVGRSTGERSLETLDDRTREALAAVTYLRSRPEIRRAEVGLWGASQGGWVTQMAAAASPDVAFVVSVSGSGVRRAEQEVYSVEAQSRAFGFAPRDVAKAVLFSRLIVDWQLTRPVYRARNLEQARRLGAGPWSRFAALVYAPGALTPAQGLRRGIAILESISDESWAHFLYLDTVLLPALRALPADQVQAAKIALTQVYLADPMEHLAAVRCPVLAVWGARDTVVPPRKSAAIYRRALAAAGNGDVTVVVFAAADHSINGFFPAYWGRLTGWLTRRFVD